jgi:hypothetical protein
VAAMGAALGVWCYLSWLWGGFVANEEIVSTLAQIKVNGAVK